MPTSDDYDLVVMLSGGCSLNTSPGKNWVENAGGLPSYICKIARAIMRSGKSKSTAIAIAVSRTKKWAAGGDDVDADTRAKAAAAVAEWEKLKAKSHAKNYVKATSETRGDYLMLANTSYNVDSVRSAWDAEERVRRNAYRAEHPAVADAYGELRAEPDDYSYRWIKEMWSDYILVTEEAPTGGIMYKIPYGVQPLSGNVYFGTPVEVKQIYIEVDDELTEAELSLLSEYV